DEVARHTFGTSRRGFDPAEVRAYLEAVARELVAAADREHELRRAVAEAERRAANPVLDEATLTAALGQETARVLKSAHDASAELVARAEGEAERIRSQAHEEADHLRSQAQHDADQLLGRTEQTTNERTAQAEAAANEMRRRAQDEATARLDSAKLEAESMVTTAREECRSMVQEAQEHRARVLADFTRRRRVLHSQIEQLRAGRERLAQTITEVRTAVDQIADDLFRAEDEARLAAEAAGRQAAAQTDAPDLEISESERTTRTHPPEPASSAAEGSDPERSKAVEELFARLRAETAGPEVEESTDPHGTVVEGRAVDATGGNGAAGLAPAGNGAAASPEAHDASPRDGGAKAPEATASDSAGPADEADGADEEAPGERDPLLMRRDEMLGPVMVTLARRLKRALADDQNDILDRMRAKGGWGPGVLVAEDEHEQRYVRAATDPLRDAARSGAEFAGGSAPDEVAVDAIALELAAAIVGPLRRRLDDDGASVDDGDDAALVELVGAAYREWKGARVERLAADQTVAAFSQSVTAVSGGAKLRWIVDDDGVECPDCDDNALAGHVPAGDTFPTGHAYPPAHAGCRCLLAPLNA
ncbi:MAG TPA: DivIVA domain-containing protein, partial [Acidimicrobiales bacterium]|nr:DivIVA domain-containing protein [Acidimicrobiales bacterium]